MQTVADGVKAEAFTDGMSFSTEQKDRLKKLVDENMLTLRAITQMTDVQLKSLGFPIGPMIELKAKAESNRIATPTTISASSGDSTLLVSSSSCSSKSPVTHQLSLEKLREDVGYLAKANDTERKHMIHFVCDELVDVSSMRKVFDVIQRKCCLLELVLLGDVVVVVI